MASNQETFSVVFEADASQLAGAVHQVEQAEQQVGQAAINAGSDISNSSRRASASVNDLLNITKASGDQLATWGKKWSIAVTAPLLLIGKSVMDDALKFERAKASLDVVTGSTAVTMERLKELRELAGDNGYSFPQLVTAENNLRQVGMSADETDRILKGFAKGANLAPNPKALELAIYQLSQMSNKTKGYGQDLRSIKEQIPAVGKVLTDLYGTVDSEKIANMGVTGRQAANEIAAGLMKLKDIDKDSLSYKYRVFENAQQEFKIAVGENLLTAFTPLIAKATELMKWFGNLTNGTRVIMTRYALIAAAIGPLLYVAGGLKNAWMYFTNAVNSSTAAVETNTSVTGQETTARRASLSATQRMALGFAMASTAILVFASMLEASGINQMDAAAKTIEDGTADGQDKNEFKKGIKKKYAGQGAGIGTAIGGVIGGIVAGVPSFGVGAPAGVGIGMAAGGAIGSGFGWLKGALDGDSQWDDKVASQGVKNYELEAAQRAAKKERQIQFKVENPAQKLRIEALDAQIKGDGYKADERNAAAKYYEDMARLDKKAADDGVDVSYQKKIVLYQYNADVKTARDKFLKDQEEVYKKQREIERKNREFEDSEYQASLKIIGIKYALTTTLLNKDGDDKEKQVSIYATYANTMASLREKEIEGIDVKMQKQAAEMQFEKEMHSLRLEQEKKAQDLLEKQADYKLKIIKKVADEYKKSADDEVSRRKSFTSEVISEISKYNDAIKGMSSQGQLAMRAGAYFDDAGAKNADKGTIEAAARRVAKKQNDDTALEANVDNTLYGDSTIKLKQLSSFIDLNNNRMEGYDEKSPQALNLWENSMANIKQFTKDIPQVPGDLFNNAKELEKNGGNNVDFMATAFKKATEEIMKPFNENLKIIADATTGQKKYFDLIYKGGM